MGLFDLVPKWLLAAAVAALLALSGWQAFQLAGTRADVATAQRDAAALQLAIADANTRAAQQAAALSQAVTKAQNEAKSRENTLRAAADSARSESDGLRNDLNALRGQYDQLSRDAVIERAAAVGVVLDQCARQYQGLAEKADRHANDVRTLIEAWPRSSAAGPGDLQR